MFKRVLLAAVFLIPAISYAQVRRNNHFRIEGFSVKTDAIALARSWIKDDLMTYAVSGELYFNDEFSLSADLASEKQGAVFRERRIGGHFRWYLMQDDCSCSSFFIGSYATLVNVRNAPTDTLHTKEKKYLRSFWEGGFTGGYQAIFNDHFIIDPFVEVGLQFPGTYQYLDTYRTPYAPKDIILEIRIQVRVGYRF